MSVRCSRCFEKLDSDDGSHLCPRCREEAPDEKAKTPRVFGRYEILSEISRGAMGIVYRAREESLGRVVALKVLLAGEHASEEQVGRFIREAKAIARLRHPNIVPIHDVGEVDGRHYFTMDYIEGKPLSRLVAEKMIEPRRALNMVEEIADAIHCAHEAGVVHRDIKPSNIMLDQQGRPLIMDFGLAKPVEGGTRYTRAGTTIGTPAYMPPEQARGEIENVGPRSDVYSIGAVLYELLTGVPPFDGDNMLDVILDVIHEDPVPPRKKNPRINPDIQTIILHALEKDPLRRYQSAAGLRDDIRRYKDGLAIRARPPSMFRHLGRWCWRHKFEVGMTAVVAAVLVGVGFLVQNLRRRMDEAAREARLVEQELEKIREGDKPVWNVIWQDDYPSVGEEGRWREQDSFLAGRELVPGVREPFLGSLKLTATASIDEDAPEDVTITCGLFSTQDEQAPVPFYGTIGAGRMRAYAIRDIEQSGAAKRTKQDLTPLIERDVQPLVEGTRYLVMFERRGMDVRFQVAGEGLDEVLEIRNVSFSNWRAKNLYPVLGVHKGVSWSSFRLAKLIAGKMDTFETADFFFFIGEYNGAQSDYATIVDSPRAPHRVNAARLRLGMCAEIKREFEKALEWYTAVDTGEDVAARSGGQHRPDDAAIAEARLREPFCRMALGKPEEAARAFAAFAEKASSEPDGGEGEGPSAWQMGSGHYAWKLAGLAEGFVKADLAPAAAEVIGLVRPAPGWPRVEKTAVRVAGALAKEVRTAELLALADACPGADLAGAFSQVMNSLVESDPEKALAMLTQARKRYPGGGDLFSEPAARLAGKLVQEERFAEVTGVHETWPLESVARVFDDAAAKAAEKGRADAALEILAFAHSRSPDHTDGLRKAAVELARGLKDDGRFADVRRVFESYPDAALAPELRGAVEGATEADDLDEALLLLEFARQNLGPGDRGLEEAAARVSEKFAASTSIDDALRVADSVAAYPSGAHVPHVRKAIAVLAGAGRASDAAVPFAAFRGRSPEGDAEAVGDMLAVIEGISDRAERDRVFDVLAGAAPLLANDPEARARWLVEFGDIALRTQSRPDQAEELYREAASSDGDGRSRAVAVAKGRLALLLEALGRREEATGLWEFLLQHPGTPEGLRKATEALLARVPAEALAQWQAAHPADLSAAEMSLYLGIRAVRLGQKAEAVEAFRRIRGATRGRRWPYHILGRLGS